MVEYNCRVMFYDDAKVVNIKKEYKWVNSVVLSPIKPKFYL